MSGMSRGFNPTTEQVRDYWRRIGEAQAISAAARRGEDVSERISALRAGPPPFWQTTGRDAAVVSSGGNGAG